VYGSVRPATTAAHLAGAALSGVSRGGRVWLQSSAREADVPYNTRIVAPAACSGPDDGGSSPATTGILVDEMDD
jgi:hypothetical protein